MKEKLEELYLKKNMKIQKMLFKKIMLTLLHNSYFFFFVFTDS